MHSRSIFFCSCWAVYASLVWPQSGKPSWWQVSSAEGTAVSHLWQLERVACVQDTCTHVVLIVLSAALKHGHWKKPRKRRCFISNFWIHTFNFETLNGVMAKWLYRTLVLCYMVHVVTAFLEREGTFPFSNQLTFWSLRCSVAKCRDLFCEGAVTHSWGGSWAAAGDSAATPVGYPRCVSTWQLKRVLVSPCSSTVHRNNTGQCAILTFHCTFHFHCTNRNLSIMSHFWL